jgi:hypothetical protein
MCSLSLCQSSEVVLSPLSRVRFRGRSYFKSKWNCLDGFVVTVSLIALAFPQVSIFRAFRAMRPLRVIVRSKKIQVCDGGPFPTTLAH